jgi:hypothetical protein
VRVSQENIPEDLKEAFEFRFRYKNKSNDHEHFVVCQSEFDFIPITLFENKVKSGQKFYPVEKQN